MNDLWFCIGSAYVVLKVKPGVKYGANKVSKAFELAHKESRLLGHNTSYMREIRGARTVGGTANLTGKLVGGIGGGALVVANVAMSGEIRPSHIINGAAAAATLFGVGAAFTATWFVLDYGIMGINYMLRNGPVGMEDIIDNLVGRSYKIY